MTDIVSRYLPGLGLSIGVALMATSAEPLLKTATGGRFALPAW